MAAESFPPWSAQALADALRPHGLRLRGGFAPEATDVLPALPGARAAAVVWMVGQVGAECWDAFSASPFAQDGLPDPMDRWSRAIAEALAQACGGAAVLPGQGPPWAPFQQWALRIGEGLEPSPLGLHLHPEFGLWHAWRFALVLPQFTADDSAALRSDTSADVCARCVGQPCLRGCPVTAFTAVGFDAARCTQHLDSQAGQDCLQHGCRARDACPVGAAWRYTHAQAAFHLAAFAQRRR